MKRQDTDLFREARQATAESLLGFVATFAKMPPLPDFPLDVSAFAKTLRRRTTSDVDEVWCLIRRKWLRAQPEEVVRQALLTHFEKLGYPPARMQVERRLLGRQERYDVVVLNDDLAAWMLVEVKAPHVSHREGLRQLADYARTLRAPFCLTANGSWACCIELDYTAETYVVHAELPTYLST